MDWYWKTFREMELKELYQALELRNRVFVVEQNCAYQDCDGADLEAWHLLGYEDGVLVAYLRALAPNSSREEARIGRVVTSPRARKMGYGKEAIRRGLENVEKTFGRIDIGMSAQSYLERLYESFGFRRMGPDYLEDGLPHVEMLRRR